MSHANDHSALIRKGKFDVFVSHTPEDHPWAAQFNTALREQGVKTWFDASDLAPGDSISATIQQALRDCQILVIIYHPSMADIPMTYFELGAAVADGKRIIPVAIQQDGETRQLPVFLSRFQAITEASPEQAAQQVAKLSLAVSA